MSFERWHDDGDGDDDGMLLLGPSLSSTGTDRNTIQYTFIKNMQQTYVCRDLSAEKSHGNKQHCCSINQS